MQQGYVMDFSFYITYVFIYISNFVLLIPMGETTPAVDFLFFGYVIGQEAELGYFSLSELEQIRGRFGLPVERDLSFKPCRLSKITSGERR
jgi:Protein of unknown function (DUF2958)